MPAEIAAGYVGERTAEAFLKLVGTEYPKPVVDSGSGKGRRMIWAKADLDRALGIPPGYTNDPDPPEAE